MEKGQWEQEWLQAQQLVCQNLVEPVQGGTEEKVLLESVKEEERCGQGVPRPRPAAASHERAPHCRVDAQRLLASWALQAVEMLVPQRPTSRANCAGGPPWFFFVWWFTGPGNGLFLLLGNGVAGTTCEKSASRAECPHSNEAEMSQQTLSGTAGQWM